MSISEHKQMPSDEPARVQRFEVFTGAGRRRSWSPEEKATIVAESLADGETVCGVARRHGLTPQQVFNEFSSGQRDATAIKRYMKMLYDRAGADPNLMPRYLLLFGDGS